MRDAGRARCSIRARRPSCSTCARTAAGCSTRRSTSPASSSPTARSSRPTGAAQPRQVYTATGGAIAGLDPGRGARRPGHRLGGGDRHRRAPGSPPRHGGRARTRTARASSRRSSQLSNGGALDITVGRVLHAQRAQPRRRRRQGGRRASSPTSTPSTIRTRHGDDAPAVAAVVTGLGAKSPVSATGRAAPAGCRAVAVLERRGKFLVAEPFFERGPRLVVEPRPARSASATWSSRPQPRGGPRRDGRGASRAAIAAPPRAPRRGRDVIEALMLDRGLRRSFDPAVEREAREAASVPIAEAATGRPARPARRCRRSRSTRSARATSTTRSRPRRARTAAGACGSTSPTSRPTCPPRSLVDREAYRRGTSVYVPGRGRADAARRRCRTAPARWCRGRTGSAVTVEMTITGRHGRSGRRFTAR